MKRKLTSFSLVVFFAGMMALGLVLRSGGEVGSAGFIPAAQAKDENKGKCKAKGGCSERTVCGTYAFALTGNVQGTPIAAAGTTTFDGEGNVSITGTINTTTLAPVVEGTFAGTYTVNREDCTATATVTVPGGLFGYPTLHFKGVIINNGEEVRYLITDPGIVFAGATVKQ